MEDLGEILRRLAIKNSLGDRQPNDLPDLEEQIDICENCGGRGWLTLEAPVGDPDFGRTVACDCQRQNIEEDQHTRLLKYSNLGNLSRFTFDSIDIENLQVAGSKESYLRAYESALDYGDRLIGWLVLVGPNGSGKTHLAAAIGNRCIERGHVVFFSHVPDLLDHLRSTFSPASDLAYSELFEQVKSTPILILDGLGSHSTTSWAEEKLGQIINHRYNMELPTVVTSSVSLSALDQYIATRLQSSVLSKVIEIEPKRTEPASPLGRIEPGMLGRMTFDRYDLRGNNPTASQKEGLESAHRAATAFAADPEGWLTLSGETGVGKTHLAVAIAATQLEQGKPVIFAFVPELMDYLRYTFKPGSPVRYDCLFEEVKNAPLLILDDLGKEQRSDWAVEKLYQIIVHRHNVRLPTVITSMMNFDDELDPITSRVQDPSVSIHIRIKAPDYRNKRRRISTPRTKRSGRTASN